MKYLRFCIFLFILSTIVYPNEELQTFHLIDNKNFTLENGVLNYYTTYCYNETNCTSIITFHPNNNPNSSAIIEVGTQFANYNISLNTFYTVYDSNVELMPITPVYPVDPSYPSIHLYAIIKIFVINLTSETSSMNVWDALDHVLRRCEVASGGIPPSRDPKYHPTLQDLAYIRCVQSNTQTRASEQRGYIVSKISSIYLFLMIYIMIIPYVIGLLFSVLNVVLFIQQKSLKSPFMMFVAIQSFYCIVWCLWFFLYAAYYLSTKGFVENGYGYMIGAAKSIYIQLYVIILFLMQLCSFGIETIRFFKAFSRVFALRFPLWSSDKLTIKHALFLCLSTFILGIIAWVFVALDGIARYTPDRVFIDTVINTCGDRIPNNGFFLYIVDGWGCFPQYILFDELFPLNLITLLLDCYVFFLLKVSELNDQQKRREKVLKLFIVMDLIDVSYSCFRRMLLFVYSHNHFGIYIDYADFTSQWSMFYYNAFAKYIIMALVNTEGYFFYMIRLIFYVVEMVICQMLMRRIQEVENPHDVPRTFVDRFLLKFTKKFYTRVLRVQPTTAINNTINIVGR